MLISHRKKFIYIKTIKTASTSVEIYFEPWAMPENTVKDPVANITGEYITPAGIVARRGRNRANSVWHSHKKGRSIKSQVGDEIWNSYFKFCVIRNPYDRAVSRFYYQNLREEGIDLSLKSRAELQAMFTDFVTNTHDSDSRIWTINGTPCVDKVIRYDQLAHGMQEVCNTLDIPWDPSQLGDFKSGVRPANVYTQLYTAEARAAVESSHSLEFKLFDFKYPGT